MIEDAYNCKKYFSRIEFKAIAGSDKVRPKEIFERTGHRVLRTTLDGSTLAPGQSHEAVYKVDAVPTRAVIDEYCRIDRLEEGMKQAKTPYLKDILGRADQGDAEAITFIIRSVRGE